jgi:hypothetical protein
MSRGRRRTRAALSDVESDATPTTYDPANIWVALLPSSPGPLDEQRRTHTVETDYHPQLTTNTILTLEDGRHLYVRGLQDVAHLHHTHILYCEEVLTP